LYKLIQRRSLTPFRSYVTPNRLLENEKSVEQISKIAYVYLHPNYNIDECTISQEFIDELKFLFRPIKGLIEFRKKVRQALKC